MFTFENLFKFVMQNKKDKSFIGMTALQIAYHLKLGLDQDSLWYKEEHGRIVGMILADINREKKHLFIKENLSMSFRVLQEFARRCKEQYFGYTFEYYKHNKHHVMDSDRFFKLLGV